MALIVRIFFGACAGIQSQARIFCIGVPFADAERAERSADINIVLLPLLIFMGAD